jgi:capping protein beta
MADPEKSKKVLEAALDVMQRMPPKNIEHSLSGLLNLVPEETDELLQRIDQPLQTGVDPVNGKPFLLCDYNRDGDSFRSPWSSEYDPPLDDGLQPTHELRKIECLLNEVFSYYVEQYYGAEAISSVYCWDLEDAEGFASCWLVKKDASSSKYVKAGSWDSIHVVDARKREAGGKAYTYRLTSTVMVSFGVENAKFGEADLSGSLIRQHEQGGAASDARGHAANIGKMIEDMENDLRGAVEGIYLSKSNEIIASMHHGGGIGGVGMLVGLAGKKKK